VPEPCPTGFDQSLISGYLDQELTQSAEQRVRLHLEDCPACRELHDQLQTLREASMTTQFTEPDDTQWDERPRTVSSLGARAIGWGLLILWLLATAVFGLYQAWIGAEGLLERLLLFGGLSGGALLFLSVLLDRLKAARTDRYREVKQ
jgi:predicted anti-sigma-YlaC factor YlaD